MGKQISDFVVFDKIANQDSADGIASFGTIVNVESSKRGALVTVGIPSECLPWILNETHHFVLYAVKKEDFLKTKSELENANA